MLRETASRFRPGGDRFSLAAAMELSVGEFVEAVGTDGGVVAKELAERGLGGGGKEIETEIGGADVVGLFDDELAVGVVAGNGSGEGEGEEEAEEAEDFALDGGEAGTLEIRTGGAGAESAASFEQEGMPTKKKAEGSNGGEGHGLACEFSKLR